MLSHLDRVLFPDRCEVIEIIPSQRYVYPIFKNGSSSLRIAARKNNWRIKINEQITQLTEIDVVVRHPLERFISGINTDVQMTSRDNPTLDPATILWFAKNYLFLNRHYCPQLYWILHLSTYTKSNARLNFIGMDGIESITSLHIPPNDIDPVTLEIREQLLNLKNNEMYLRIDEIIFDCIGQSLTVEQLIQNIKKFDIDAYNYVIGYSQKILNPTYVLS